MDEGSISDLKVAHVRECLERDALEDAVTFLRGNDTGDMDEPSEVHACWESIRTYLADGFRRQRLYVKHEDTSEIRLFHPTDSVPIDVEYLCSLVRWSDCIISTNHLRLFHPEIIASPLFDSALNEEVEILSLRMERKRSEFQQNEEQIREIEEYISTLDQESAARGNTDDPPTPPP
eukprot:CAMPEP_0201518082 /NCGR_PEP_ID=MMETSP0161_2-20130828/9013_1 /ASSEMBLY_ACC=CAM_ASM_000251 /TAXON_ID=180227 /ORGANISM="Neoparamoeba aestuarina, Strain SoJaBio B1-5/56/2" /LENGTH=176 /DNA_ID=CAMNT_0047915745 /DNA_START=60 /DNA_END=586 /DNA_ORIENTATION=+